MAGKAGVLAVAVALAGLSAFGPGADAAVIFADDFSAGLDPAVWRVQKSSVKYSIDAGMGDVRISSTGLTGRSYNAAQVFFRGTIVGDFDMRVDFRDAVLNLVDYAGQAANHVALHARFGSQHFATTRDIASVEGNNYHVYLNPPGQTVGVTQTTLLFGTLRITRVGNTYAGYFNNAKIYEATYANTNPSDLWFSLENNQTNDAISVTYDNFVITADDILGIPEPATAGWMLAAAGLTVGRARRR